MADQEECGKSKGVTKSGKTWENQEGVAEKGCGKRGGVWQMRRGVVNEEERCITFTSKPLFPLAWK